MLNSLLLLVSFRNSSIAYFSSDRLGLFSLLDICKLIDLNIFSVFQFIALLIFDDI